MDQTSWVIQVLDDSNNMSIEYPNRFWLRQNVKDMHIHVCVEDCAVDVFGIADKWGKEEGTLLIQDGKEIQSKSDFHPAKEALLLVKWKEKNGFLVFLYTPKK